MLCNCRCSAPISAEGSLGSRPAHNGATIVSSAIAVGGLIPKPNASPQPVTPSSVVTLTNSVRIVGASLCSGEP